jgi:hypothetical protein
MMNFVFLIIQGGLMGYIAGLAFPDYQIGFWLTVLANSTLVVAYGIAKKNEL